MLLGKEFIECDLKSPSRSSFIYTIVVLDDFMLLLTTIYKDLRPAEFEWQDKAGK